MLDTIFSIISGAAAIWPAINAVSRKYRSRSYQLIIIEAKRPHRHISGLNSTADAANDQTFRTLAYHRHRRRWRGHYGKYRCGRRGYHRFLH